MTPPRPPCGRGAELCFVAPRAYPLLSGDTRASHIGGAEVQQALVARGLAQRGRSISMITLDVGQDDGRTFDGVLVLRSHREEAGLPGLRFFWPRITRVWAAMRRANALVYYQRTSDSLTGVVAAFCRRHRRRFIFSVGAVEDCFPSLPNCRTRRERVLYRYGLRHADVVLAQTRWQREALARHFGVASVVVRSAAPDPGEPLPFPLQRRHRLLWAGRLAPEKRPELLLELARRCPGADFDVLGTARSGPSADVFNAVAAGIPNLRLHGYVPHAKVGAFYEQASALVCTSAREGFPNTFLEAWSRARPVLTTVDPDNLVRDERIGVVADEVGGLVEAARGVHGRRDEWAAMGLRARTYYLREHEPDQILDHYENVLDGLSSREAGRCSR
jgi:glycosyltransferase involved in cell wall biosynthesis